VPDTVRRVTIATVAVVVLAGCGGGSDPSALPDGPAPAATTPAPTARATAVGDPVTTAYLAYWDAVVAAHRGSDPRAPGLARVAADPELTRVRGAVDRNRVQQVSVRGEVTHRPARPAVSGGTATLDDCFDVTGWTPVDVRTGDPIEAVEAGGTGRYKVRWTLRGSGGDWKVVDQKALGGC
jgi:hypothetical protein